MSLKENQKMKSPNISNMSCHLTLCPSSKMVLRSAQKAKLKLFLLENIPTVDKTRTKSIADGGTLLWCCDWRRNEPFDAIFKKYVNFLVYLQIDIVVFDRYEISTKDHKRTINVKVKQHMPWRCRKEVLVQQIELHFY